MVINTLSKKPLRVLITRELLFANCWFRAKNRRAKPKQPRRPKTQTRFQRHYLLPIPVLQVLHHFSDVAVRQLPSFIVVGYQFPRERVSRLPRIYVPRVLSFGVIVYRLPGLPGLLPLQFALLS